jgi:hypothetical protein
MVLRLARGNALFFCSLSGRRLAFAARCDYVGTKKAYVFDFRDEKLEEILGVIDSRDERVWSAATKNA